MRQSLRLTRFIYPSPSNPNRLITSIKAKPSPFSTSSKGPPISNTTGIDDAGEWNDAWETAWLPDDPSPPDVTFPSAADVTSASTTAASSSASEIDADTKAFVAEMDERWNERRAAKKMASSSLVEKSREEKKKAGDEYRLRKQRIHAGLWMKEIEKMEEAKLSGDADGVGGGAGDEMDRLLDSCSE